MREKVLKPERESRIDTCVECVVRERDFSQKTIYRCKLCDRWFCEKHIEPRLAFIRDLRAIEHSPEVRVLYYTEMRCENGHPDFEYSRRKFRQLDIEEKKRNELIKQALDKMNHYYTEVEIPEKPIDVEADRKKRVEMLQKEEAEIDKPKTADSRKTLKGIPFRVGDTTLTYQNRYHHHFRVPTEAYSSEKYRQKLNNARTLDEVEHILDDYYKHHQKP